jgi:hypothetical protein
MPGREKNVKIPQSTLVQIALGGRRSPPQPPQQQWMGPWGHSGMPVQHHYAPPMAPPGLPLAMGMNPNVQPRRRVGRTLLGIAAVALAVTGVTGGSVYGASAGLFGEGAQKTVQNNFCGGNSCTGGAAKSAYEVTSVASFQPTGSTTPVTGVVSYVIDPTKIRKDKKGDNIGVGIGLQPTKNFSKAFSDDPNSVDAGHYVALIAQSAPDVCKQDLSRLYSEVISNAAGMVGAGAQVSQQQLVAAENPYAAGGGSTAAPDLHFYYIDGKKEISVSCEPVKGSK